MIDFERGRIRFIRGGKYPQSNSVLIDDDIRTIIDPACDEEKLLKIHGERPIEVIINSHGHEDHFLYNSRFPDAQLWVHELDANAFRDINAFFNQFFHPEEVDEKTEAEWSTFFADVVKYQPREPDRLLEDEEILDFGETRVHVLHTPGHSPGHLSFHFAEEKVLFLADLDLVKFGPYYGDKASSIDDTIRSLHRLAKIEVDVYLVSHGKDGILDGDPEHIHRYLDVIYKREEKLLDLLASGPKSLEEVTAEGIIYGGRSLSEGAWELSMSERTMMHKHLQRLDHKRTVKEENGFYHLV
ncbi:MAG: MBL fold metallo-hydrolase [Desulfobacterales bacterium]|nr:MAG: MBL fold metallo-hydrolase [Desulfobacterales bacterium]